MPNPRGTDGDPCARHLMRERCTNTSIAFIERPAKARLFRCGPRSLALATTRCVAFTNALSSLRVLDIEHQIGGLRSGVATARRAADRHLTARSPRSGAFLTRAQPDAPALNVPLPLQPAARA